MAGIKYQEASIEKYLNNFKKNKMKRFKFQIGLKFVAFFIAAILLFGAAVMALWNAILPAVLGVSTITFGQALGILVLSKILFGGFGRGGRWQRENHQWGRGMRDKWVNMTPEEREKFKADWKNRCSQ